MSKIIRIRSFNGIGDLLFLTPTLRKIKEEYKRNARIIVNTNIPLLLKENPYVDIVGTMNEGLFLGYPDPIHAKNPTCHHIISDWKIVCAHYGLQTDIPDLKPEIYLKGMCPRKHRKGIGVQIIHKSHWDGKKVWPFFNALTLQDSRCVALPHVRDVGALARTISSFELVVCAEGGISHMAKALGVPAIVIYGGFAKPEWNGYTSHINVCNPLDCSYCYNPRKCENSMPKKCLVDISVNNVIGYIDLWTKASKNISKISKE